MALESSPGQRTLANQNLAMWLDSQYFKRGFLLLFSSASNLALWLYAHWWQKMSHSLCRKSSWPRILVAFRSYCVVAPEVLYSARGHWPQASAWLWTPPSPGGGTCGRLRRRCTRQRGWPLAPRAFGLGLRFALSESTLSHQQQSYC